MIVPFSFLQAKGHLEANQRLLVLHVMTLVCLPSPPLPAKELLDQLGDCISQGRNTAEAK
jgi:hypothetical protein